MKLSDIFKFKLFEGGDKANLKIVNENFEIAEKELDATNKEITDKVTEINNKITELNGLLGGKLDVSKIANNLVTTEEGYALDARMGKVISSLQSDLSNLYDWEFICEHSSTENAKYSYDISKYKFLAFRLCYYNSICNQVILPVNSVQNIRTISAFIDDVSNIAIVYFEGTTTTQVSIKVIKNVNNGVSGMVFGIK